MLTECSVGTWGVSCLEVCSCADGSSCDRFTGDCDCGAGKTGRTCEEG